MRVWLEIELLNEVQRNPKQAQMLWRSCII